MICFANEQTVFIPHLSSLSFVYSLLCICKYRMNVHLGLPWLLHIILLHDTLLSSPLNLLYISLHVNISASVTYVVYNLASDIQCLLVEFFSQSKKLVYLVILMVSYLRGSSMDSYNPQLILFS